MAESAGLWDLLRQTADPTVVAALEQEVAAGPDRALNRVNAVVFAAEHGLSEEATISALVHAARLGLFDLAWSMLCPGCGGVLEHAAALKAISHPHYYCSLCEQNNEPTLDQLVEATFTVSPRVRRIGAHDPQSLPLGEYMRQIFWGSGAAVPEDADSAIAKVTLDATELHPGEKASMSLNLPAGVVIALDPVTHSAYFMDIAGEQTAERRNLSIALADAQPFVGKTSLQPGPVRITFENKCAIRTLPSLWVHGPDMDALSSLRRPYLTATRLLSNQTFRDLYRSGTFDPEQRFKITSLTILFTDLRGSTELYDRVGDLAAFDLVRSHFHELLSAVSKEGGAVVKTIGDAVMATFPTPDRAIRAAIKMREGMRRINEARGGEDLALNIGLHEGPCLAVVLDDRQDYFGLSVNVASRVQGLADPTAILATRPIVDGPRVAAFVEEAGYEAESKTLSLRGVTQAFEIYEIREKAKAVQAA